MTHFVVVTDDESFYKAQPTPEARSARFQQDMQAPLGKSFILHTISSAGPEPCRDPACVPRLNTPNCQFPDGCGAHAPGLTYYVLARLTNGLTASICESDWAAIFRPLSDAVIASAPLPCNYQIPAPPKGETLDAQKVNVRWRAPGSTDAVLFSPGGERERLWRRARLILRPRHEADAGAALPGSLQDDRSEGAPICRSHQDAGRARYREAGQEAQARSDGGLSAQSTLASRPWKSSASARCTPSSSCLGDTRLPSWS